MTTANTVKEQVFNIMAERGQQRNPIPLRVMLQHAPQAYKNHLQSLGTLNRRGGLSPKEALHVLYDLSWNLSDAESKRIQTITDEEADRELRRVVRESFKKLLEEERVRQASALKCVHGDRPVTMDNAHGARRCPRCKELVAL